MEAPKKQTNRFKDVEPGVWKLLNIAIAVIGEVHTIIFGQEYVLEHDWTVLCNSHNNLSFCLGLTSLKANPEVSKELRTAL